MKMAELAKCNFKRQREGEKKIECYFKLGVYISGSDYGKCDGEENCVEFQKYKALIDIANNARKPYSNIV